MRSSANYLAGIGYASIFGFSFLVTKEALTCLDPFELLAARFVVAALVLTLLVGLGVVRVAYAGKPARDLVITCLLQPLVYFTCETFGVREAASSTAGLMLGVLPATVALAGAAMLGERLSVRQSAYLALSVAGVSIIMLSSGTVQGHANSPRGIIFLLGAVVSATFYNIYSRKSSRAYSPVETTLAMMWTGAVCFGTVAFLRALTRDGIAGPVDLATRAGSAWPSVVYLGTLSSVVAFILVNFTLSRLKASQSVVFANLTTVVAVAAAVVVGGEGLDAAQWVGSAMIVVGVWGTNAGNGGDRARAAASRPAGRS